MGIKKEKRIVIPINMFSYYIEIDLIFSLYKYFFSKNIKFRKIN